MALKHLGFRNLAAVLVLGGAIVGFTSKMALAQPAGPEVGASGRLVSGASDFRQYCAQCHGLKGVGDGPVAPALAKKPANLTLLSKNNGGVFPEQEVYNFIDGTSVAEGHGTREMPIWGYVFKSRQGALVGSGAPPLTPTQVHAKIQRLVQYVRSIQQP
jgi:mono/diheme cytochrome c family protein